MRPEDTIRVGRITAGPQRVRAPTTPGTVSAPRCGRVPRPRRARARHRRPSRPTTNRSRSEVRGGRLGHHLVPTARHPPAAVGRSTRWRWASASATPDPRGSGPKPSCGETGRPVQGLSPNHREHLITTAAAARRGRRALRGGGGQSTARPSAPTPGPCCSPSPTATPCSRSSGPSSHRRDPDFEAFWHDFRVLVELMTELPDDRATVRPARCRPRTGLQPARTARHRRQLAAGPPRARRTAGPARSAPATHPSASSGMPISTRHGCGRCARPIRKCARTFATALELMDRYPEYTFAVSQAQHLAWMRDHYPDLWERMKERSLSGASSPPAACGSKPTATSPRVSPWSARSSTASASTGTSSASRPTTSGCPTCSATRAALPQIMRQERHPLVPHPEALVEPVQHPSPPHLSVGGHRRLAGLHPLPAVRHLQRQCERPRAAVRRRELQGPRSRHTIAVSVRLGRRRRRPHRRDARVGSSARRPRRRAPPHHGGATALLHRGRGRDHTTPPSGWASSTSSSTAAPTPAKPPPSSGTGGRARPARRRAVDLAGTGPSRHDPERRATRGALEAAAAPPVPRHHPGIGDPLGLRGHGPRPRPCPRARPPTSIDDGARHATPLPSTPRDCSHPVVVFNSLSHTRTELVTTDAPDEVAAAVAGAGARRPDPARRPGPSRVRSHRPGLRLPGLRPGRRRQPPGSSTVSAGRGVPRERAPPGGARRPRSRDVDLRQGCGAPGPRPRSEGAIASSLHPDYPNFFDAWDIDRFAYDQVVELDEVESVEVVEQGPLRARVRVTRTFGSSSLTQLIGLTAGSRCIDFDTEVRLARDQSTPQGRLPCRRPQCPGHLRDPVRARGASDARQHELGRGPVRGLRAQVGRSVRARLRRGPAQRLQVRL